jgi:8-oxo-dGTP diphosphatase
MSLKNKILNIFLNIVPILVMIGLIPVFRDDYILTLIYIGIILVSLFLKKEKGDIPIFFFGFFMMILSEMVFISTGVETFIRNTLFDLMPLWLPFLWGYGFIVINRGVKILGLKNRELQVGVKILLKNKNDEYLVLFRAFKNKPTPHREYWDAPGGRINTGSNLIENLKREVMEETGLEIKSEPRLITVQDIIKEDKHVVRLTYVGFGDGEVKLSHEHSDYKWLNFEDLSKLDPIDSYLKKVLIGFSKELGEK